MKSVLMSIKPKYCELIAKGEENIKLINKIKVKEIHFAWDNPKDNLEKYFKKYTSKAKHKPHGHFGTVYCLTNFNSTFEEDLYRIYTLRGWGFDPYVVLCCRGIISKKICFKFIHS